MKYQICVSGAARGTSVEAGKKLAFKAGAAIAKAGHILLTGATIGLPNIAAQGAKSAGGLSVGISPAISRIEHTRKYHLPIEAYDAILFSGQHYLRRDVFLVATSDAVICIGGRIGTLHEFAVALEMHKPVGVLEGAGGTSAEFKDIMRAAGLRREHSVIFETDASKLLKKLLVLMRQARLERAELASMRDHE